MDLVEEVIRREWDQFQRTENEGGRASCQGNWPMFHQMRASQFMTWPEDLLRSYLDDLDEANRVGRNLVTEKYARMMASTAPDEYRERIEPFIPRLSDERIARQERVITVQVAWARDFRGHYPRLGAAMRVLTTAEDTPEDTSFETYLRGELGTYSDRTMALYEAMVEDLQAAGRNLTEQTVANTVRLGGFADLTEAEAAQAA
ncbi:hypothetical protein BIGA_0927 [Bifidobacterium pullorum subsp. gallinarum]|uniref:DUF4125 family protein n=1 Tax=Bifidobacterium pullorum subsp. gallinarum TaxID=78344 RepID=A0A087ANI9_9BIFI|nr:DUF4125 family protein [Bifidobacterium pullorum]KFI60339.1 hypothetical protein BIGA_0927 [Bifidobacterium pullorum subsp. gallinarum]